LYYIARRRGSCTTLRDVETAVLHNET